MIKSRNKFHVAEENSMVMCQHPNIHKLNTYVAGTFTGIYRKNCGNEKMVQLKRLHFFIKYG